MAKVLRRIILPYGMKRRVAELTGVSYSYVSQALRGGYITQTPVVMKVREEALRLKKEEV